MSIADISSNDSVGLETVAIRPRNLNSETALFEEAETQFPACLISQNHLTTGILPAI